MFGWELQGYPMMYEDVVRDFAERSRKNLETIEGLQCSEVSHELKERVPVSLGV